uniref:InaF motif containing 2 n=1 Tax=Anopheles coluzzii TaxID=1518534 RepID=A0A8W7PCU5_ANOCL
MDGGGDQKAAEPLYARDAETADGGMFAKKKEEPKWVRVIVVCIYLFTVSFAALLLSLYYIFFWTPKIEPYEDDSPERLTGDTLTHRAGVPMR